MFQKDLGKRQLGGGQKLGVFGDWTKNSEIKTEKVLQDIYISKLYT